jgi:hypothetical protein
MRSGSSVRSTGALLDRVVENVRCWTTAKLVLRREFSLRFRAGRCVALSRDVVVGPAFNPAHTHLANFRQDAFDLLGLDIIMRQQGVNLVVSNMGVFGDAGSAHFHLPERLQSPPSFVSSLSAPPTSS